MQQMFISHSSGAWEARDQDGLMVATWYELSTWLYVATFSLCPHMAVGREREKK